MPDAEQRFMIRLARDNCPLINNHNYNDVTKRGYEWQRNKKIASGLIIVSLFELTWIIHVSYICAHNVLRRK